MRQQFSPKFTFEQLQRLEDAAYLRKSNEAKKKQRQRLEEAAYLRKSNEDKKWLLEGKFNQPNEFPLERSYGMSSKATLRLS